MESSSRRDFVKCVVGAIGAGLTLNGAGPAAAYPLGLAPGLQLWTVKDALGTDEAGTLKEVARIGYRELELYQVPKSPGEFKKRCDDLGLRLTGSHVSLQSLDDPNTLDVAHQLALQYLIVVFPTLRAIGTKDISKMSVGELNPLYEKITADDYRWNAEQFNRHGAALKRDGLQLGYHNHAVDLKTFGLRNSHRFHGSRSRGLRNGLRAYDSCRRRSHRLLEEISRTHSAFASQGP